MMFPNIDAERARIGMTKAQLAKELQVCEKTLYNWERSGNFTLAAMNKMAELFGCTIDYLMGRSS